MKKRIWILAAVFTVMLAAFAVVAGAAETSGPPAVCPHCKVPVTWTALNADEVRNTAALSDGHYYPVFDGTKSDSAVKSISGNVCLWLNGKTLAGTTRGLYIKKDATLSIMGEGTITGRGRTGGYDGGCAYVEKGGTLNLYSGNLSYVRYQQRRAHNGGVVYCAGTFNMYGGSVIDGKAEAVDTTVYCNGGNIFVADNAAFNMEGGTISGGYAGNAGGNIYVSPKGSFTMSGGSITGGTTGLIGPCVIVRGATQLSGDAKIDILQMKERADLGGPVLGEMLTVKGVFTGDVKITLDKSESGLDIGTSDGADLSGGSISVRNNMLSVAVSGGDLVLSAVKRCDHCKEIVTWQPLSEEDADGNEIESGHYYLDFAGTSGELDEKYIYLNQKVCLDLNGKELYGRTRAFSVFPGGELNIMGDGTLKGRGSDAKSPTGGTLYIAADGTVNLYSGVLTHADIADDICTVVNGGVIANDGNLNIYGGTITGGYATNAAGSVFVENTGSVKMYGGTIENGKADAAAPGIYCKGSFLLSGDASVSYLLLKPVSGGPTLDKMLTVSGEYTGSVLLVGASAEGRVFGVSDDAVLTNAKITFSGKSALRPAVWGDSLVAVTDTGVMAVNDDGFVASYADLSTAAESNVGTTNTLVLLKDSTGTTQVSGDVTVDLNGYDIEAVEVGTDATLYCLDSHTDDCDVSDNVYGRILSSSGAVKAAPGTDSRAPYMMVDAEDGLSFHCVKLQVRSMSLRPGSVGLYFKCSFDGDSLVKQNITGYGVALSLAGAPTTETMGSSTLYTVFDKAGFGTDSGETSCLVNGIMKPTNTDDENLRNSGMQIYGAAYVAVGEGEYIFSDTKNRSLEDQMTGLDENLNKMTRAQKNSVQQMYNAYTAVMGQWNLSNIEADIEMKNKADSIEKNASREDVSGLESLYAGRKAYFGELHDHAATGGTSDGKQPLSVWKHYMEALDIDFATIVDHRQTLHMRLDDWDNTLFVGGSEPATTITDREGVYMHYNMIVSNPEALENVLYQFPEFDFRIWTEEDRAGCGGQMHFAYPRFTGDRFTELCNAIYDNGGFVSIVHPKSDGYITSENPEDAWFRDGVGIEVFYTYHGSRDSDTVKKNYALWTGLLAAGKKVYATSGNDEHNMPSTKGLSTFYTTEKHADRFVENLRAGNFTAGVVGVRMAVGDTVMGGTTDFTGKRLVFSVGDFHSSVADPTHTYRVDLISDEGIVFSQEVSCTETSYFAIDAQEVGFYRVEVFDITANSHLAIGNPIWNE